MKTNKVELDVDFIGEQVALKPEEEKAISEFFRQRRMASRKLLSNSKIKKTNQINSKEI
jgi:hypothetical protein